VWSSHRHNQNRYPSSKSGTASMIEAFLLDGRPQAVLVSGPHAVLRAGRHLSWRSTAADGEEVLISATRKRSWSAQHRA